MKNKPPQASKYYAWGDEERAIRLRHAKRLAGFAFNPPEIVHPEVVGYRYDESARKQRAAKLATTANQLYTPQLEQSRALAVSLQKATNRIGTAFSKEKPWNESTLMQSVMADIRLCIGDNCDFCAYLALLEPGGRALTVKTQSHGAHRLGQRFRILDEVDSLSEEETLFANCISHEDTALVKTGSTHSFKLPFICVPMRTSSQGRPLGILIFDGFCQNAPSSASVTTNQNTPYTFPTKDDEAAMSLRLWRHRDAEGNGIASKKPHPVSAHIVAGHIQSVDHRRHHSVYSLQWEDGLIETEVSSRAIKEVAKHTPATLGVGIPCNDMLQEFAEFVAMTTADHLFRLRCNTVDTAIHKLVAIGDTSPATRSKLFRLSLGACLQNILSSRVAEIWQYDSDHTITIIARHTRGETFRQIQIFRRLLEIPVHRRHSFWDLVAFGSAFIVPMNQNLIIAPIHSPSTLDQEHNGLLLAITRDSALSNEDDLIFANALATTLSSAVSILSAREVRANDRKAALDKIIHWCQTLDQDLESFALAEISQCFPGASISIGHLASGGQCVKLLGHDEFRPSDKSTSLFDCLPPKSKASIILRSPAIPKKAAVSFSPGLQIDIRYGKAWYPGVLIKDRGRETFDVIYDAKDWRGNQDKEAGVHISRIRIPASDDSDCQLPAALKDSNQESSYYPIILVPLGHCRGVICLHSWTLENKEPNFDEPYIVRMLESVGSALGKALDTIKRRAAIDNLANMIRNAHQPLPAEVKAAFLKILLNTVAFPLSAQIYDISDLLESNALPATEAAQAIERCRLLSKDHDRTLPVPTLTVSDGQPTFITLFEECEATIRPQSAPALCRKHRAILWTLEHEAIVSEEMAFVSALAKTMQDNLAFLTARNWQRLWRRYTIADIFQNVDALDTDALLQRVINRLSREVFIGSHVVIGTLLPGNQGLSFSHVSSESKLRKRVVKSSSRTNLPLMQCVENAEASTVLSVEDPSVNMNGESINRGWPWMCHPLTRCQGTIRGCLTVDNFNFAPEGSLDAHQSDQEAMTFLQNVSILLATAIDYRSKSSTLCELYRLHEEADLTLERIYEAALRALKKEIVSAKSSSIWLLRQDKQQSDIGLNLILSLNHVSCLPKLESSHIYGIIMIDEVEVARTTPCAHCDSTEIQFSKEELCIPLKENWMETSIIISLKTSDQECVGHVTVIGHLLLHLPDTSRIYALTDEVGQPLSSNSKLTVAMRIDTAVEGEYRKGCNHPRSVSLRNEIAVTSLSLKGLETYPRRCVISDQTGSKLTTGLLSSSSIKIDAPLSSVENPFKRRLCIEIWSVDIEAVEYRGEFFGAELSYLPNGQASIEIDLEDLCTNNRQADSPPKTAIVTLEQRVRRYAPNVQAALTTGAVTAICKLSNNGIDFDQYTESLDLQARQLLAASHAQKISCKILPHSIFAPLNDLVVCIGDKLTGSRDGTRFGIVVESEAAVDSPADYEFIDAVARALEANLRYLRKKELRDSIRERAHQQILCIPERRQLLPSILERIINLSEACLPGCCSYVGLLQPGGNELLYVACSSRSQMRGKRLRRGEGVSFRCVEQESMSYLMIIDKSDNGDIHLYNDSAALPYLCIPVKDKDNVVLGVLGIDNLQNLRKMHEVESELPESGIMDFLDFLGKHMGDLVRAMHLAESMAVLPSDNDSNDYLIDWCLAALCRNLTNINVSEVWEIGESHRMRVVGRQTPNNISSDLESQTVPSSKIDVPVVVAQDLETVCRRLAEDKIERPAFLKEAKRLDDLAKNQYLLEHHGVLSSLITELGAGQLINACFFARTESLKCTRIECGKLRYCIPLGEASDKQLALVIGCDTPLANTEIDICKEVASIFLSKFERMLPLRSVEVDAHQDCCCTGAPDEAFPHDREESAVLSFSFAESIPMIPEAEAEARAPQESEDSE